MRSRLVSYLFFGKFLNILQERNNCIVLRVDTCVNSEKGVNPFGFHFEFDRSKFEENKERKKREGTFIFHAYANFCTQFLCSGYSFSCPHRLRSSQIRNSSCFTRYDDVLLRHSWWIYVRRSRIGKWEKCEQFIVFVCSVRSQKIVKNVRYD